MRDHKDELYSNKSNSIIQSYAWDLKEKQLKIMELLCSCYMTNYYDSEKNTITVGVADFMRELGSTTQGVNAKEYRDFEKAIQKLSDTSIIGIGFNGKRRIIRLVNSADFPTDSGDTAVVCHMSDDFKACMALQDAGNTRIEFRTICSMDSRYSIRLYNFLRSWQGKSEVIFDLAWLKQLLNVTAKSYDNFAKFRQAVLDVAVNEINEKTTLRISYKGLETKQGRGRPVTRVLFSIKHTNPAVLPAADPIDPKPDDAPEKPAQSGDATTEFEMELLDLIPQEVHRGDVKRVRAILDLLNEYVPQRDILEFYDKEGNTYDSSLNAYTDARSALQEDHDFRRVRALSSYINRGYEVQKGDIVGRTNKAHFNYFLKSLEGWLLKNCQY